VIGGRNRPLTRYRAVVLGVKPQRRFPLPADDAILVKEDDVFFGYSYPKHIEGKYFDLWFVRDRDEDPENFVTFGRIISITPFRRGAIYTTKLGKFYIEEAENGRSNHVQVGNRHQGKYGQYKNSQKEGQKGYKGYLNQKAQLRLHGIEGKVA
jgi:hypothetical protein